MKGRVKKILAWILAAVLALSSVPALAEEPDSFSFSGGTGRTTITCTEVTVRDGQAYAVIVFDSDKYQYVKVGETKVTGSQGDGTSSFEIPVTLNANNTIYAMTTAMSQPHEIEYTLYIGLDAAKDTAAPGERESVSEDENAPEIAGLTYEGSLDRDCAEHFKIHYYENDFIVLEIDAARYLLAPEDAEVPAGLDKEMMIVRRPVKKAYVASSNALRMLDRMGAVGSIAAVGFRQEECGVESVAGAMERGEILFAGSFEELQFRDLVTAGSDLAIVPEEILPKEAQTQKMNELGDQLALLGIPMIVDRSSAEEEKLGQYEWCKVYGLLFSEEEAAAKLYESAAEALADWESRERPTMQEVSVDLGGDTAKTDEPPVLPGLEYESAAELQFAECFDIYHYSGGYILLDIHDDRQYLLVPEGGETPEGLGDIVVLQKPLDRIYLAATAVMSLFDAIDSVDAIRLSGTDAGGWYIDRAVEAMEDGDMLFAGKYNEPDYELLVSEGCDVAIESTMILHSPKVQEMIELMGIPVLIDRSSYETHPLGRTEWVKFYGALMDKEEEAAAFFDEQAKIITELEGFQNTEKTVAFFYVSTDGSVVVRKSSDYIPSMIEIAGGRYVPEDSSDDESRRSSVPMTMEEFYASAVDADYLIYNATIDDPIASLDDLFAKSELFRDFRAVKEGNVWCAGKYLYQATDIVGNMISDIHAMLTGGDGSGMTFLTKIS